MADANLFGYIALLAWAPVSVLAFAVFRPPIACAVLFLGATMLLPVGVGFDLPAMPPVGKEELASLFILFGGIVRCRRRLITAQPGRGLESLILILMLGAIGTSLTNRDPLSYGVVRLPPLTLHDALSDGIRDLLRYAVPFFLGRAFFRSERDLRDLLFVIAVCALFYSLPTLVEIRLSPQLHRWTYGFFQRPFSGTERYGGYRPMVYMANGLALALFFATAATASRALGRESRVNGATGTILRVPTNLVTFYLTAVLVLCKSFASIFYGVMGVTLVSVLRPRALMRLASIVVVLVTFYPLMRANDVFPVQAILGVVKAIDEQRWDSLEFRFRNEDQLLERARERSLFGWGGYRRSRTFDFRGRDTSITDGFWIIILGTRGYVGFFATFGLLVVPVLVAHLRARRRAGGSQRILVAGLSLIVAFHAVDLIPNGLFSFLPLFFSGALMGVIPAAGSGANRNGKDVVRRGTNEAKDASSPPRATGRPDTLPARMADLRGRRR